MVNAIINRISCEGSRSEPRLTASWSYPPTGRSIELSGMTMLRFEDGMITEEWADFDTAALQAQLHVEDLPHVR